tara:strand:- start:1254 stop:1640 length:387 start_codon:yes stop_codon:yes gene_type:complete
MAVDVVKGNLGVENDTGSGGLAAISASTYGYQSVHLSDGMDWVTENPNSKWVVEMYRDGEMIATVATDSGNATGYARVQPPDGTKQYGDGLWWTVLIKPNEFQVGDVWIVYGWNDMGNFITAYPPNRT